MSSLATLLDVFLRGGSRVIGVGLGRQEGFGQSVFEGRFFGGSPVHKFKFSNLIN